MTILVRPDMESDKIKINLLERKAELESRVERTHRHTFHRDEPVSANFNEQVKQTENDELVRALEAEAKEEIAQINKALHRIEVDVYEQCAHCGGEIGVQRLQAIPYADSCIECAE
ncbi:MAG: conjugal transfer protein TraR [Gammaproteobacteria bacterium]|jgi:RNA polymerase-binding transcription factor DksA|nr:conjugal transfer protein TraR [Gammaproteobacteria bacterium]|tara:strand:+ start:2034 stop:2381 length:348 start_codon:yes stop_codon:yes gene_type:complete